MLADEQEIFLQGLEGMLRERYEIVGLARDQRSLVKTATELDPDLLLVGAPVGELDGRGTATELRNRGIEAPMVLLVTLGEPRSACSAICSGVAGYLLKSSSQAEVQQAVGVVLAGGTWLSPRLGIGLVRYLAGGKPSSEPGLSQRQLDIVSMLAKGLRTKEIAAELGISSKTVEYHKYKAMKEQGVRTLAELISAFGDSALVATSKKH